MTSKLNFDPCDCDLRCRRWDPLSGRCLVCNRYFVDARPSPTSGDVKIDAITHSVYPERQRLLVEEVKSRRDHASRQRAIVEARRSSLAEGERHLAQLEREVKAAEGALLHHVVEGAS